MQAVIRETEKKKEKNFYVEKSAQELEVKFLVDFINKRLKIIKYRCNDYDMLCREIDRTAKKYNLTKILLTAKEDDWQKFFVRDFILESLHPALFSGQPGYHMSKFISIDRLKSDVYILEKNILKKIHESYPHKLKKIADAYIIDNVKDNDINQLLNLYKTVFTTYPTPINDREYLKKSLYMNHIFKVIRHQGKIVSAASLDIDRSTNSAELTDCATLPEYNGQGLMAALVCALEQEAKKIGLHTVYTMARARSIGINKVFYNNQYKYYGCLINNCDICGQFEDMNLWSKTIS